MGGSQSKSYENRVVSNDKSSDIQKKDDIDNVVTTGDYFFKVYRNTYLNCKIYSYLSPFKYGSKRYDNISIIDCCERGLFNLLKEKLRIETKDDRDFNVLGRNSFSCLMYENNDFQLFKLVYERFKEEFSYKNSFNSPIWHYCGNKNPNIEIIKFLREQGHYGVCQSIIISSWSHFECIKFIIDNPVKKVPLEHEFEFLAILNRNNGWANENLPEVLKYLHQALPKSIKITIECELGYNELVSFYSKYPRILFQGSPFKTKSFQHMYEYYSNLGSFQAVKFLYENNPKRKCNPGGFIRAIENGNFEIFKFLFLTKNSDPFLLEFLSNLQHDINIDLRSDKKHHVSFYKFMIENQDKRNDREFPLTEEYYKIITKYALNTSNVELLQYLMDKKVAEITNNFIYSIQIIQCLKQSEIFNEMELFQYYLISGHLENLINLKKFDFLEYIISKMDSLELTPMYPYSLLDKSTRTGDLKFYKFFLRSGKSRQTINSLNWAVECNLIDMVKYLVEECKMQVNNHLMSKAVEYGYIDIMDYLYGTCGLEFPSICCSIKHTHNGKRFI